jgi:hypothetical protein
MMDFLLMDIVSYRLDVTFADAYCPIIILPCKFVLSQFVLIYPEGGFPFNEMSDLADALFSAQRNQAMSMITPAIHTIEPNVFFSCILFYMLKYFLSQIR